MPGIAEQFQIGIRDNPQLSKKITKRMSKLEDAFPFNKLNISPKKLRCWTLALDKNDCIYVLGFSSGLSKKRIEAIHFKDFTTMYVLHYSARGGSGYEWLKLHIEDSMFIYTQSINIMKMEDDKFVLFHNS